MKILTITIFTLVWFTGECFGQKNCSLKKDENGIKIYTCKEPDKKYHSVKAEFYLNAKIQDYKSFLRDVKNYPNWQFKTKDTKVLKSSENNGFLYYAIIDSPWPVADRDMVLQLRFEQPSSDRLRVVVESKPDHYKQNNKFVRVPRSISIMELVQTEDNLIKMEYYVSADPGGSLPAWVVNMFCTEAPYETFSNLKRMLPEYDSRQVLISKNLLQ